MERHVGDTSVIQDTEHEDKFLQHINSTDIVMKLTVVDMRPDGAMPFLDSRDRWNTNHRSIQETHTQTSTYSGTVTIIQWQNTTSSIH